MRILLTGAGGNLGKGLVPLLRAAGHDLVLSDVNPVEVPDGIPFHQVDVQQGFGLERAAEGVDLILHTPAWHGIHWRAKTEIDFWRLNVDGLFWAYQAARANGVKRFVFLSSQAWHGHYDKYGFTKRIGEELCEYHLRANDIGYVAVRPADLTPWGDDWVNRYGARLLYGGVDRRDVLDSVAASVAFLERETAPRGLVLDAVRPNAFTEDQIRDWQENPLETCNALFPGSAALVRKYNIGIERVPGVVRSFLGWEETGYSPKHHFGTFLDELMELDRVGGAEAVAAMRCDY